jgi:hypothetical protein
LVAAALAAQARGSWAPLAVWGATCTLCGCRWMATAASFSPPSLLPCCSRHSCRGAPAWSELSACHLLLPEQCQQACAAVIYRYRCICPPACLPACSCLGGSVQLEASVHLLGGDLQQEARGIFPDAPTAGQVRCQEVQTAQGAYWPAGLLPRESSCFLYCYVHP